MRVLLLSLLAAELAFGQESPATPTSLRVEESVIPVFRGTKTTPELANFRLFLDYQAEEPVALKVGPDTEVELPKGSHKLDLSYEQVGAQPGRIDASLDSLPLIDAEPVDAPTTGKTWTSDEQPLPTDKDYTVSLRFVSTGDGTLFSKCQPKGPWTKGGKTLFIRDSKLVYDVGWVGATSGRRDVTDGKLHRVVLRCRSGAVDLFLDGKIEASGSNLTSPDRLEHRFKIGLGADDFVGDLQSGQVRQLNYWSRSISDEELDALIKGDREAVNTPDLHWKGEIPKDSFDGAGQPGNPIRMTLVSGPSFRIREAWVQPLEEVDHRSLALKDGPAVLARGQEIYNSLCITCHGDLTKEGSLPTALRFHEGVFKNGHDPYRIYQTLKKGYGMMVAQPQYGGADKYAVIHYIRSAFLREPNPSQHFEITEDYLKSLPKGIRTRETVDLLPRADLKPYEEMDFGPVQMWTYQVNAGAPLKKSNIAQKGIAVRLDSGSGGVSKGRAWMVYDHDTMRVAASYSGSYVDWKGIAFDGSHGTHTSIAGDPLFLNPDLPAWRDPQTGKWDDQRITGRDGRRFGPLPRDWVRYLGYYRSGERVVIRYTVGETEVLELPGLVEYGDELVFTRSLDMAPSTKELVSRIAPADARLVVCLIGAEGPYLENQPDGTFLHVPPSESPTRLVLGFGNLAKESMDALLPEPQDLTPLTLGGDPLWANREVETSGVLGAGDGAFAFDTLALPDGEASPWRSWMRLGGFDFFPNQPDRAAICTWMGDVWLVDGVSGDLADLKWRRICAGLFQPLGLKIVDGMIHVACRDQIAKLHDLNGDEEIDYVECFNNDHQVTEHFHEFAMGLQTDKIGNFYYAKSARHAKTALVPHHGTLLRVLPDGSKTEIVATGFRAANGVCLNPDGTWIVTDQEGHWNPKNRINYVEDGGFYGNMFGYHEVTDSSDRAMKQPLAWITNAFDRSPAELLWVPKGADWGHLGGTLLNLSYGYGQIYTVPHEVIEGQAQGGMCALPIDRAPTGLHRGRFHPDNQQLYVAGMFAWAGNQQQDGGFYRVRATGKPAYLPVKTSASNGVYVITFSDPLPPEGRFFVKTWDLKRTKSYGSKHYNVRELELRKVTIDGARVTLEIPDLKPTWGMEIVCEFEGGIRRVIHASIHRLR